LIGKLDDFNSSIAALYVILLSVRVTIQYPTHAACGGQGEREK
jgi:hypothetical protein